MAHAAEARPSPRLSPFIQQESRHSELDAFYAALGPVGIVLAIVILVALFLPLTALAALFATGTAAARAAVRFPYSHQQQGPRP